MKGINFKQETLEVNQQVTELTVTDKKLMFTKILQLICEKMWAAQSKNITINSLLSPPPLPPPPPSTTSCTWALPLCIHFFMENCHIIVAKLNCLPSCQINKPPGGLRLVFTKDRVWVSGVIRSVQLENNILILLMTLSFTIKWKLGHRSHKQNGKNWQPITKRRNVHCDLLLLQTPTI